jgi:hypothetical protein
VVRYIRGVPYATDVRLALLTCTTAEEFIELFGQWEERYARGEYHGTAEDIAEFPEFENCVTEPTT